MNKVLLVGRITKDPELKRTNSDIPYVQFTIAVNRLYQNKNGERQADFISCVAWRQVAELLARYIRKGSQIGIDGSVQTRNYDDANGVRHYVTEVVVDNLHFLDSKKQESQESPYDFNQPQQYNQTQNKQPYQNNQNNQTYQKQNNPSSNQGQENPFEDINSDISNDDLPF